MALEVISGLYSDTFKQARALGAAFVPIQFRAIHCSDLKRAVMTANAIRDAQTTSKPPIQSSALLREQNYGSGEGKRWDSPRNPRLTLEEHFEKGIYPALHGRSERFPGGESLDDLARRAENAIDEILMPYVGDKGSEETNIAVVSHGLFLGELIAALVKRGNGSQAAGRTVRARDFQGMKNTGWTKAVVVVSPNSFSCIRVPTLGDRRDRYRGRYRLEPRIRPSLFASR